MAFIFPDYTFSSVNQIDPSVLDNKELIILDVDNTLFFSESTETKPEILDWITNLRQEKVCVILSNSHTIEQRKETISKLTGCEVFVSKYKKPSNKILPELQRNFNMKPDNTVMIGDMRLTDIWFGNKTGMTTILTKPIGKDKLKRIKIARIFENTLAFILPRF